MSDCKHTSTYAVDTHDRIDCCDCDKSWEGQEIVRMEAENKKLKEEVGVWQSRAEINGKRGFEAQSKLYMAKAALEKIGCNETFHRLGGIDDCIRCLALEAIEKGAGSE